MSAHRGKVAAWPLRQRTHGNACLNDAERSRTREGAPVTARSPGTWGLPRQETSYPPPPRTRRRTRHCHSDAVSGPGRHRRTKGRTHGPPAITVPEGNTVFLVGHATGVPIYACNNGSWGPTSTPRATLVDDKNKVVATHFACPTWQARDGSTVVGARVNGVNAPDPGKAIPWLLLSAKSTAPGPDGDQFVNTTFVQRVNTDGGVAPTTSCATTDKPVEVPYTADYYFWKATGKPNPYIHCEGWIPARIPLRSGPVAAGWTTGPYATSPASSSFSTSGRRCRLAVDNHGPRRLRTYCSSYVGMRKTEQTRKVLHARLDHPDRERHGLDLTKEAAVAHGTLYGILLRLEDWGSVESRIDYPVDRGAPPRRYYGLAFDGAARADVAPTRAAQRRTRGRSERSHLAPGRSTMTTPCHNLAAGILETCCRSNFAIPTVFR